MATIWDNKNHSSGEQFILSKTCSAQVKSSFNGINFPCTKISSKEYSSAKKQSKLLIPDNHKPKTNDIVFYFESDGVSYEVNAVSTLNNSNFTWSSAGTSTNRTKMTIIKETASLAAILKKKNTNSNYKTDGELIKVLKEDYGLKDVVDYWKPVYFSSAIAHANLISKTSLASSLIIGERQQDDFSEIVYKIAKDLTSKAADNWNPADLWFMNKSKAVEIKKVLTDFKRNIDNNLNKDEAAYKYKMMLDKMLFDGDLVGVSLKQIDNGAGKCNLVTYNSIKDKSRDMNFKILKCYIRDTKNGLPAYGELQSECGFNIKFGGRANATKANINLEGQMMGATHQLGAIDSKVVDKLSTKKGIKIYKDSDFSENNLDDIFNKFEYAINLVKKEQPNIYNNYFRNNNLQQSYLFYGFVEVKRFIACVSMFEFINSLTVDEVIDFFLLAKKIDKINPNYYLLH